MADEFHIEMRLLSQLKYVCAARTAMAEAGKKLGLDEGQCHHVSLAISEALANVIHHGYGDDDTRPIWVRMRPAHDGAAPGIEVVVEDECGEVDLSAIRSRPLDEVRPGGLGVHIIREVMDEVHYELRENGEGVRLRMTKFADTESNPAASAQKGKAS